MQLFFKTLTLTAIMACSSAYALNFNLEKNTDVYGEIFSVTPKENDTFSRYARSYDIGAQAIKTANPGINENYPDKQALPITIPAKFILPQKRQGIIVNLPELRLYYFTPSEIYTYPVSVGRVGWRTPIKETKVTQKEKDPVWDVPASILAEHEAQGRPIPSVVPAGPNNPLGQYALHLGLPGYLIHGTNVPPSIGRRVSHGCIRLFPDDIKELFGDVSVGTTVSIINEPIKAGWKGEEFYLEVHPLLEEYPMSEEDRKALVMSTINQALNGKKVNIDEKIVDQVIAQQSGVVTLIGKSELFQLSTLLSN